MKKHLTLFAFSLFTLLCTQRSFGQMVGDCVFLQGNSLEVGISPLGSFGSSVPSPAPYHPNGVYSLWDPGASAYNSSRLLGFVADPSVDGWASGVPPMYGDYFLPGTPQEGWSIQANGVQSNAWTQALTFAGSGYSGTLSGTSFSYSTSGSVVTGIWKGQIAGPIAITQTTKLDINKLYFTVNVVIKNNGAGVANNVYYLRTLDPDNDEEQSGNFYTTNNIAYQLPNPGNKVMVTAAGTVYPSAFLGLGTKDCRAKCFMIDFGLTPSYTLDQLYNQTTPYYYNAGATYSYDAGIGLVYRLGNIAPGDSTELTYAYVMRATDLDSALNVTAPTVSANSTLLTPGSDTINACALSLDTINATIGNGTGYTWTWSPPIGLSSTTGTSTMVFVDSLTGITTYTVIGIPISGALCANDTFHFTVIPGAAAGPAVTPIGYCQFATADPLTAGGANLLWYTSATGGTGSPTAPTPSTAVIGTFTWWVTQHITGCSESVRVPVVVTISPVPVVNATSNSPVCSNQTLLLMAIDTFTVGNTYSWSGPMGYTSTDKNNAIVSPSTGASGIYTVTLSVNGCIATDTTNVVVNAAPLITGPGMIPPSACNVSDGSFTIYGLTPGETYTLFYTFNGGTPVFFTVTADASGQVTVTGLHAGLYSGIYVINSYTCQSNALTISLPDGAGPSAPVITSNGPICADSTLTLFASDTTTVPVTYHWSGPNGFTSTLQNPVISPATVAASGTYFVTVTLISTGCTSPAGSLAVVVKPTPSMPSITSNSPVCDGSSLDMAAASYPAGGSYSWSGPASYTAAGPAVSIFPATMTNSGVYTVVATLDGCPSLPGMATMMVNPIPPAPSATDVTYCQYDAAVALTASGSNIWYTTATGGTALGGAPVPSTSAYGTFTWYVSQVVLGCESSRTPLVVTVNPKPTVSIIPARPSVCQGDTLTLHFEGLVIAGATYLWNLPVGATLISGSLSGPGPIVARFDSAGSNEVALTVSANGCTTTNYYTVHVIATPTTGLFIAPDICVGDTTVIALTSVSPGITAFTWHADSTHLHIVSGTSALGGGPYSVYWDAPGIYTVSVTGFSTQEVCPSLPMFDTVNVHALPSALFTSTGGACTGDSALFTATTIVPGYTYAWSPSAFFAIGGPSVYGLVLAPGYVTLSVTDPYGCTGTYSAYYAPSECCRMTIPNAFTPDGDGHNDMFRPLTEGHHLLRTFRIVNRWGATVFETTNSSTAGWDGTVGGVPQDIGTYYWFLSYRCDGRDLEQRGDVTLVR